jgi:DnaJ-domain-containing protein 1
MHPAEAFRILGVEPRFDLSPRELRAAWMRCAAAAHPDAAGAVDASARVNDAMRVLSDPIQRAQALLSLLGAPQAEARPLPQEFLLEMMELRERADECAGDDARTGVLRAEAEVRREDAIVRMAALFAAMTSRRPEAEEVQRIEQEIGMIRAFGRMIEQLDRERGSEASP